jgi:uncharacterized protein YjbJ (UPF0337 family)
VVGAGDILVVAGSARWPLTCPRGHPLGTKDRSERDQRRKQMKPSTKDQIEGKLHEVKGKIKEKAGQVTNNPDLEAEGQAENLGGKIQKKVGQIKKVFGQ